MDFAHVQQQLHAKGLTLKNTHYLTVFVLSTVLLGGCVVSIGNNHARRSHSHKDFCGGDPECESTVAEINAAAKLFSDSDKIRHYKVIAARESLAGPVQVYLVNKTYRTLFSEAGKVAVLLTLIDNPGLTYCAKNEILSQLNGLFSSSSKNTVLTALEKHGPCLTVNPPLVVDAQITITDDGRN